MAISMQKIYMKEKELKKLEEERVKLLDDLGEVLLYNIPISKGRLIAKGGPPFYDVVNLFTTLTPFILSLKRIKGDMDELKHAEEAD